MKHYLIVTMTILFALVLNSCASTPRNIILKTEYTNETWRRCIFSKPKEWLCRADAWFLRGVPNDTELANRRASKIAAVSTSMVNVAHFSRIYVQGGFQVQIFGSDSESGFVFGPNAGAHTVSMQVVGNTLYVRQMGNVQPDIINKVIVRIGVRHLTSIEQMGSGSIEAVQIYSDNLCIKSSGMGNIFISGHMNLRRIDHCGGGCINVFGVDSRDLELNYTGVGSVNLMGKVGVRSIVHSGSGDINIIGAHSDGLTIYADGRGKIGMCGYSIYLCSVIAKENTFVYVYNVVSDRIRVKVQDNAHVGLAGRARELNVNTCGCSAFWGRDLCACTSFAQASDGSHINFTAGQRGFANAIKNSSIYFFGPANILAQNVMNNGVVLISEARTACNSDVEYRPYAYTLAPKGETSCLQPKSVPGCGGPPACGSPIPTHPCARRERAPIWDEPGPAAPCEFRMWLKVR